MEKTELQVVEQEALRGLGDSVEIVVEALRQYRALMEKTLLHVPAAMYIKLRDEVVKIEDLKDA